jgi:hypothetical protein
MGPGLCHTSPAALRLAGHVEQTNHGTVRRVPDQDRFWRRHRKSVALLLPQGRARLVVKALQAMLSRSDDQPTRSLLELMLGLCQRNAMGRTVDALGQLLLALFDRLIQLDNHVMVKRASIDVDRAKLRAVNPRLYKIPQLTDAESSATYPNRRPVSTRQSATCFNSSAVEATIRSIRISGAVLVM